jgi:hypothetical protein
MLSEKPTSERYACLSNCWGNGGDVLKTTVGRESEFKTQVPWNELPKSFQDAVNACRRLGVNFLWIDSLCIIQDSVEDVSLTLISVT